MMSKLFLFKKELSSFVLDEFLDEFEIMSFEKFDESVRIIRIDIQDLQPFSREYGYCLVFYRNTCFLVQDEIILVFDGVDMLDFFRAQSENSIILMYFYRFYGIVEKIHGLLVIQIPMVFLKILQVVFCCISASQAHIKPYFFSGFQEVV